MSGSNASRNPFLAQWDEGAGDFDFEFLILKNGWIDSPRPALWENQSFATKVF